MSEANLTLSLLVGVLFAAGSYLLLSRALIRAVVGFALLGHAANLVLLLAGGPAGAPPVAGKTTAEEASDPLPQAMALTAVVITFAVTALLLALAHRSLALDGADAVPDRPSDERPPGRADAAYGEERP